MSQSNQCLQTNTSDFVPPVHTYFEHILHGQIETKEFWLGQMQDWETDRLGNTPEQQFELILQEVTEYHYLMWQFKHDDGVRVFNAEYGKGTITQVYDECPNDIVVEVTFDNSGDLVLHLSEILGQYWSVL